MTNLEDYKTSLTYHDVPTLGYIVWYHVGENMQCQHPELVKLIVSNGAQITLPNAPKPTDIFKRACTAAAILKVPAQDPGEYFNYTLRDAGYDEKFVYKKLVQEHVDSIDHELGFTEIGDVVFDKLYFKVNYKVTNLEFSDVFSEVRDHIDDYIQSNALTVTPYALRMTIMNTLLGPLSGSPVRPGGGVYFISKDYAVDIIAVDKTINEITGASFHYLPLVDDQKQREMVRDSFEDESVMATQKLMNDINELLKNGGSISAKKFVGFQQRYAELFNKMKEYQGILNDALATSSATLELCEHQIKTALDNLSL